MDFELPSPDQRYLSRKQRLLAPPDNFQHASRSFFRFQSPLFSTSTFDFRLFPKVRFSFRLLTFDFRLSPFQKVSSLLFILAAALLAGTAIAGLKIAKRRLKPRRILMIILAALLVSWALSLLIEQASDPSPPGEGPSELRD